MYYSFKDSASLTCIIHILTVFAMLQCVPVSNKGFVRGAYACECKDGYYFPDAYTKQKAFNGSILESMYSDNSQPTDDEVDEYQCLVCAEGCDTCVDDSPCQHSFNIYIRTILLILTLAIICFVLIITCCINVYKKQKVKYPD